VQQFVLVYYILPLQNGFSDLYIFAATSELLLILFCRHLIKTWSAISKIACSEWL